MAIKKVLKTKTIEKPRKVRVAMQPVVRIQTAEGWRRSMLRKHLLATAPVKKTKKS